VEPTWVLESYPHRAGHTGQGALVGRQAGHRLEHGALVGGEALQLLLNALAGLGADAAPAAGDVVGRAVTFCTSSRWMSITRPSADARRPSSTSS
jgi:hypothetical protein